MRSPCCNVVCIDRILAQIAVSNAYSRVWLYSTLATLFAHSLTSFYFLIIMPCVLLKLLVTLFITILLLSTNHSTKYRIVAFSMNIRLYSLGFNTNGLHHQKIGVTQIMNRLKSKNWPKPSRSSIQVAEAEV